MHVDMYVRASAARERGDLTPAARFGFWPRVMTVRGEADMSNLCALGNKPYG